MTSPLASVPIVSTTDPDEAQQVLSRELAQLRFKSIRDRRSFHLEMNGIHLGRTLVGYNQFATDTVVDPGEPEGMFSLAISPGGVPSVFCFEDEPVVCTKMGAVTSPAKKLLIHRPAGSGMYLIRASSHAIEERIQEELPRRLGKPIVFDRCVDLSRGVGGQARRLLKHLVDTIRIDRSALTYPLVRTGFDELLLNILVSLPNDLRDELARAGEIPVAPEVVRRAEEFMEGNATEPITISDIARHCNCSRGVLFAVFRKHRPYTPMQFLAEVRLMRARKALQFPTAGCKVTIIAYACGFSHLGRFAEAYRKRFRESPSATLRKAGLQSES